MLTLVTRPEPQASAWALDLQRQGVPAASLPKALHGQRLYFEVSRGPYAAGETSFIGETISRLGLGNVVDKSMGPFPNSIPNSSC